MTARQTGVVKFFHLDKGYGFITPDGGKSDVFLHRNDARRSKILSPKKGQRVSFEITTGEKGPRAVSLMAEQNSKN